LVAEWNQNLEERELPYNYTTGFIRSLGTLIYLRRRNGDIQTIPDKDIEGFNLDPLCLSCIKCR